jgi:hypothetical protein
MISSHALLRRVERTSVIACAGMAALAWVVARGQMGPPLGVLGGGLLVAISYRGIKGGIDAAMQIGDGSPVGDGFPEFDEETRPRSTRPPIRPRRRIMLALGLVKFFTRYAILSAAAYVIMARLRLPPVAVIAGASSLVFAVTIEAVRSLRS